MQPSQRTMCRTNRFSAPPSIGSNEPKITAKIEAAVIPLFIRRHLSFPISGMALPGHASAGPPHPPIPAHRCGFAVAAWPHWCATLPSRKLVLSLKQGAWNHGNERLEWTDAAERYLPVDGAVCAVVIGTAAALVSQTAERPSRITQPLTSGGIVTWPDRCIR